MFHEPLLYILVLSLDFPFGFRSCGWLFILLLWRDLWLRALGHCSVHSGVTFSFLLDSNGFLLRTTVGVSFLLWTWCVVASGEFSVDIRLDSPQCVMGLSKCHATKHSENVHKWSLEKSSDHSLLSCQKSCKEHQGHGRVMIMVPQVFTETFRNPFVTSVFGRFCNSYCILWNWWHHWGHYWLGLNQSILICTNKRQDCFLITEILL